MHLGRVGCLPTLHVTGGVTGAVSRSVARSTETLVMMFTWWAMVRRWEPGNRKKVCFCGLISNATQPLGDAELAPKPAAPNL